MLVHASFGKCLLSDNLVFLKINCSWDSMCFAPSHLAGPLSALKVGFCDHHPNLALRNAHLLRMHVPTDVKLSSMEVALKCVHDITRESREVFSLRPPPQQGYKADTLLAQHGN